jgi:hypothetical protein
LDGSSQFRKEIKLVKGSDSSGEFQRAENRVSRTQFPKTVRSTPPLVKVYPDGILDDFAETFERTAFIRLELEDTLTSRRLLLIWPKELALYGVGLKYNSPHAIAVSNLVFLGANTWFRIPTNLALRD